MQEAKAAPQVAEPFPLSTLRHSVSHLMASAVAKLYPGAKFGFGPAIEHGFYYDFDLPEPLTEADLRKIEKEMARIAKRSPKLECIEVTRDEAKARLAATNQTYKVEAVDLIPKDVFICDWHYERADPTAAYFALKGDVHDGHDFVAAALKGEAGA